MNTCELNKVTIQERALDTFPPLNKDGFIFPNAFAAENNMQEIKRIAFEMGGVEVFLQPNKYRLYSEEQFLELRLSALKLAQALIQYIEGVNNLPPVTAIAGTLEEQYKIAKKAILEFNEVNKKYEPDEEQ